MYLIDREVLESALDAIGSDGKSFSGSLGPTPAVAVHLLDRQEAFLFRAYFSIALAERYGCELAIDVMHAAEEEDVRDCFIVYFRGVILKGGDQ